MIDLIKASVNLITIDENCAGQRIDNFLFKCLKGVPKSHVYRLLRGGEVRVNRKRVGADYRLLMGDLLRVPPVRMAPTAKPVNALPVTPRLDKVVLYEDDALVVLNKPAGMAVHGGSGISLGVIEQLRLERPQLRFLELAHRLDRETSGVLILAKKRAALVELHRMLREGELDKRYLALVKGRWRNERQHVKLSLHKYLTASGERRVSVHETGQASHTLFLLCRRWDKYSLLEAELKTGRTHQIRVHLSHLGFPIAGDDKYGDFTLNKELQRTGLKRMFLHARCVTLTHPMTGEKLSVEAPLPRELEQFLDTLQPEPEAPADGQTI